MAFLKGRLYRKSSERSRATSVDDTTTTKHRKSESTSSRSASVPDAEKQESINIEVEQLFQQATDTDNDLTAGRHGHSKKEPSLFLKFMKRKVSPASSTGLREGISRSFSHLGRRSPSTEAKSDEGRVQSSSPDFASETGYDSDALFIPSPRFSELSSDSVHPCSPVHMERTMTSLNHVLANDLRSQPNSNEENEPIAPPSTERPRLNDLSISKRRKKIEHPMEKSSHSYSQRTASNVAKKESERTETTAGVENLRKRSRFTEMFHLGMRDDVSLQQSRRVSIGWMSEGKRCGYGYSFVDKEKAASTSSLTEAPADDSSGTEEWQSTRDVVIPDDSQHADDVSQSNVETFSQAEDEESVPEREITLPPYQRLRWTIFPSHTKSERNLPMDLDDGVIVRDFCVKASPDRPQQDSGEEKKRHLISNAIRQGFHDTFLWVIGLGKREIARYHAGLEVHAARSHDCVDPTFETTVPYWDNAPKEELGDYHIEAWRAAKQRQKKRDGGNLGKFRVSVTHAVDVAAKKARKKSTSSSSSSSSSPPKDVRETPLSGLGSGTRYVGRRHSAKF